MIPTFLCLLAFSLVFMIGYGMYRAGIRKGISLMTRTNVKLRVIHTDAPYVRLAFQARSWSGSASYQSPGLDLKAISELRDRVADAVTPLVRLDVRESDDRRERIYTGEVRVCVNEHYPGSMWGETFHEKEPAHAKGDTAVRSVTKSSEYFAVQYPPSFFGKSKGVHGHVRK